MKLHTFGLCPDCKEKVAAGLLVAVACSHFLTAPHEPHVIEAQTRVAFAEPVVPMITTGNTTVTPNTGQSAFTGSNAVSAVSCA